MSISHTVGKVATADPLKRPRMLRHLFAPLRLLVDALAVCAAAFVAWSLWSVVPFAQPSSLEFHMRIGVGTALIVVLLTVLRNEHRLGFYLSGQSKPRHVARIWNMAMVVLIVAAFLTRRADDLSRGAMVFFYVFGFAALWASRSSTTRAARLASKLKLLLAQRILVVGTETGIDAFLRRHQPWNFGLEVVGSVVVTPLSTGPGLQGELHRAIDLARDLHPDDVYVAVPWSETDTIDACLEAFLTMPIAIHLAPERVLERFDQISISRVGAMASLELTRPMPAFATAAKRLFDLVASLVGLVVLGPLFLIVSLLIKLDSQGPVFFHQTRYGFNQRPFRIIKFRTMTTFSDGADVQQAQRDDRRVTRIGRLLRRTNIDELPQLVNVLLGQMSLVGPRPHAVPHNRAYERRIGLYARRHNVKPGITGWAQVHGLRGETDTEDKMRRRVEYDLFYIDNWSMLLDLRIMLRTLFSARAYRNAV